MPTDDETAHSYPDFRVLTQGTEIGAGWMKKGDISGKKYVSLLLAAPEFGSRNSRPISAKPLVKRTHSFMR